MEFGVIGFGNFGKFFAEKLAKKFKVTACDTADYSIAAANVGVLWGTLEETASKEVVVFAVPLQAMEVLLAKISYLNREVLLVDVCSVKVRSIQVLRKFFPESEILATHPLFGPQSAKDGWAGHRIVVCPVPGATIPSEKSERILQFFREEGLHIIFMPAEEHDRQMAKVQGLTHFIARGLAECGIDSTELATTASGHLLKVVELLGRDSWELFQTIQIGNSYAEESRNQFLQKLQELEKKLGQ